MLRPVLGQVAAEFCKWRNLRPIKMVTDLIFLVVPTWLCQSTTVIGRGSKKILSLFKWVELLSEVVLSYPNFESQPLWYVTSLWDVLQLLGAPLIFFWKGCDWTTWMWSGAPLWSMLSQRGKIVHRWCPITSDVHVVYANDALSQVLTRCGCINIKLCFLREGLYVGLTYASNALTQTLVRCTDVLCTKLIFRSCICTTRQKSAVTECGSGPCIIHDLVTLVICCISGIILSHYKGSLSTNQDHQNDEAKGLFEAAFFWGPGSRSLFAWGLAKHCSKLNHVFFPYSLQVYVLYIHFGIGMVTCRAVCCVLIRWRSRLTSPMIRFSKMPALHQREQPESSTERYAESR